MFSLIWNLKKNLHESKRGFVRDIEGGRGGGSTRGQWRVNMVKVLFTCMYENVMMKLITLHN
jgi:hypothetical protein